MKLKKLKKLKKFKMLKKLIKKTPITQDPEKQPATKRENETERARNKNQEQTTNERTCSKASFWVLFLASSIAHRRALHCLAI